MSMCNHIFKTPDVSLLIKCQYCDVIGPMASTDGVRLTVDMSYYWLNGTFFGERIYHA